MTYRTPSDGDPSSRFRLPYTVEPRRYQLHLIPDLESATFSGTVSIEAEAHDKVSVITLHAEELEVRSATVTSGDGLAQRVQLAELAQPAQPAEPAEPADAEHQDRISLVLGEPLAAGPLLITLEFTGILNDKLHGFYRSTFTDADGVQHTIATTQFEATDARRAFPCFDEPDRKAVFGISLDVPAGLDAFSNGPVVSEETLPGGGRRLRFADTIPMSTYLVAFVVGPLVSSEPVDVDGIPVRVVHVPGREAMTSFALEAAAHALRFFAEWFGLPYPAEKLDLVAIPDFAFGAMENLGCVTFRETALLADLDRASRLELERVADVVSHEIAHMWFGDLVTMKWWNGIWLNEAFATLMELMCVDHFRPEWQRWASFAAEREAAMGTDGLHSTRPVEYPVGPPEEAQGMFDVLTYEKGAAVLRMLERYLGGDRFRQGIRLYLSKHRLANTETADLWDALEQATGEPVGQIMDTWILQGGFPIVVAERTGDVTTLRQEPFSYAPADATSAIGRDWRVPVLARPLSALPAEPWRLLLADQPAALPDAREPVLVNAGASGFYRVQYDDQSLLALADRVGDLSPMERATLLGDTWAALVAGHGGLGQFLSLAEALRRETDADVWAQVASALGFLDLVVVDEDRPVLAAYTRALVGPAFASLGWQGRPDDDDERTATLRAKLLGTLGTVGADAEVRQRCMALHGAALDGGPDLDPDLAPAVVAVVAAAGGEKEFEAFLARQRAPRTPQEEVRYLFALAGFDQPELARRAFEVATTEARTQNGPFLIQQMLGHRSNGPATWARLTSQWDTLVELFPANIFPRMLDAVQRLCRQAALADEVRSFLADHPVPSGQRSVAQAVERLGVNVTVAQRLSGAMAGELSSGIDRLA